MGRTAFFVSDGTAITAETFGHTLMTQFSGVEFRQVRLPFVDTPSKARDAVSLIDRAAEADEGKQPVVFSTIVDPDVSEILVQANCHLFDLFGTFVPQLEDSLGVERSPRIGQAHGMGDTQGYEDRMEATNYALTHDDGISKRLDAAEVILVGVSRSGKTPTCLYMALHFGIKAANYPLTEEDLEQSRLPAFLREHKHKLFGLSIDPERLAQIRENRRPGSRYASLKQCRYEVEAAEAMLRVEGVPTLSSTASSIEELASRILLELGLQREMR
ncbi:kinase/pyrophosphorylase [Wenzhouxiangella sp. XN201]|uniref:posphoenolpyruvate synthetase regulatory kinase/phosphorylase PpsR n=1 Tax=Wenzhouxiangella sp. XN201 TaxID=2710755 RepID=UPI0013CD31B4|nr:pyruvate, water dikinase regulatory protein [Wenzhouxiangella sp. XN201]NEZ04054.1 kinase/pyrophosphorylase [Wenzhouxiangella sp. XN201]